MISFGSENPVAALDQAMADGVVDSAQGAALRKQLLEHPGQALDEGRMEALSHMSGAQLRAQVGAGQLSRDDMHAVVKRQSEMAQAAADKRDNGVGVARDFTTRLLAKDSELVNRGLQHMAHWVGDEESEEQYRQTADVMGDMGSGKFGDTNPGKDSLQAVGQWMEKPLVEIPTPGADFMKAHPYLGGMATGAAKFASGFTTPENILMMVATEGMGPIARKLVGMGFTVMNAKQIVEQSKDLLEEKDPEQRMAKGTQLLLMLEMMISGGKGKKGKGTVGEGEGQRPQSGTTEEPLPGEAGGEPQLKTGEPRLLAKDGAGGGQQKASLPAKPQAPLPGLPAPKPGVEEPALVSAGEGETTPPQVSGDELPPDYTKATPIEDGKSEGGSSPKNRGNKSGVSDFTKKPETQKQPKTGKNPIHEHVEAILAKMDPRSRDYKAIKKWYGEWQELKNNPDPDSPLLQFEPAGARSRTVGRTPGINSPTGIKVVDRMKADGEIIDDPENGTIFKASDGRWYSLELADMSHNIDAVIWWNAIGRFLGRKTPKVRKWMLDSDNYTLDYLSPNRRRGAILTNSGVRYLPPADK